MAGFISEWWPASNRNGGRLQIGNPGRIESEFARNAGDCVTTRKIGTPARSSKHRGGIVFAQLTENQIHVAPALARAIMEVVLCPLSSGTKMTFPPCARTKSAPTTVAIV